jgi:hypothetical protein
VARGVHWLMLSPPDTAARQRRYLQQLLNDQPLLAFSTIPLRPEGTPRWTDGWVLLGVGERGTWRAKQGGVCWIGVRAGLEVLQGLLYSTAPFV